MKKNSNYIPPIIASCAMFMIILDAKTAVNGAKDAIALCLQTVIPSLFPFFILSGMINSYILGVRTPMLRPLGKICRIPEGAESLLLLGLVAGYPVGAQLIANNYRDGAISKQTARRMLGFCNNAGPAFIFGMVAPLFDTPVIPWILWAIHIVSALMVGILLPGIESTNCQIVPIKPISVSKSLNNAIRTMAVVCSWVLIFRIIISFCDRWFLWAFPDQVRVILCGILELSNGCYTLADIPQEEIRFFLCSIFIGAGGLCVGMQTASVTAGVGTGYYYPGKLLQCCISAILCCLLLPLVYHIPLPAPLLIVFLVCFGCMLIAATAKKSCSF